jgi:uncharacterized protein with NRDE domain
MCITFFGFDVHPKIKFFLLFNRDEFLNRPTIPFKLYEDCLIYSLDELTGGTFLCFNVKNGNFSCLLNNPFKENPYSDKVKFKRGMLPIEFCRVGDNFDIFFNKLNENRSDYNGFNLLCGNIFSKKLFYYTNNEELNMFPGLSLPIILDVGKIHSIENIWIFNELFATKRGKENLKNLIDNYNGENGLSILLYSLINKVMFDGERDSSPGLDFSDVKIAMHSSIFKNHYYNFIDKDPLYFEFGTRQTIGIIVDSYNNLEIVECFKKIELNDNLNKLVTVPNEDLMTKFVLKLS